jgi:hypothetical protein
LNKVLAALFEAQVEKLVFDLLNPRVELLIVFKVFAMLSFKALRKDVIFKTDDLHHLAL